MSAVELLEPFEQEGARRDADKIGLQVRKQQGAEQPQAGSKKLTIISMDRLCNL